MAIWFPEGIVNANVNEHRLLEHLALLRGQLPVCHRHVWTLQSHLSPPVLSNEPELSSGGSRSEDRPLQ